MGVTKWVPLGWFRRLAFGIYAFAATASYAGSFSLARAPGVSAGLATAVGIAAGVSWPFFGAALLLHTGGRPTVLAWADTCLRTMAVGNTVLFLSVAANLLRTCLRPDPSSGGSWQLLHLAILLGANLTMAAVFNAQARRLGMRPVVALGLWFGVLGGVFFLALALMKSAGILLP